LAVTLIRHLQNILVLTALIAGAGLILALPVAAQTFSTLHNFNEAIYTGVVSTNLGGADPAQLLLSGNTLFGTAIEGSTNGNGVVFAVNTDGSDYTVLHTFSAGTTNRLGIYTNTDGTSPSGGLVLSGNTLYGTADRGGTNGSGLVFALETSGSNFIVLHYFAAEATNSLKLYTNLDGIYPGGLTLSGSTLYGVAEAGGTNGEGTLYSMGTNGLEFTMLHTFGVTRAPTDTNSDGANPSYGLLLVGTNLYGAAQSGGTNGDGTIFAINTNGTNFMTLHHFAAEGPTDTVNTNSDGFAPNGGLVLAGDRLYGTANLGGTNGFGTVFGINTNGMAFALLHTFSTPGFNAKFDLTNSDGVNPNGGLVFSGDTLYGSAYYGGTNGLGTLFGIETNGAGFATLHTFGLTTSSAGTNGDGAVPLGGLILSGSTLYGSASLGGAQGGGTVFSLSFAPQLAILNFETYVVLTWPTNLAGFDLSGYSVQSTTNLVAPSTWSADPATPAIINGVNTVTNEMIAPQQFFRLVDP
jgi:uncharacterized repeat protein (TIGR03803 family)